MACPTGPQHYPQGPRPPQGMTAAGKVGVGCAGVLLAGLLMLVMLVGCAALLSGGNSSGSPAPVTTLSPTQEPTEASDDEAAEEPEGEPAEEPAEEESEEEPAEEDHPGLGETVEHGDWDFTVHSIDYAVPASDLDPYFSDEPSGQWVAVEMSVTNLSSGPQWFSGNDQVLMDAEGSMYRYDLWASDLFGDELNPGTETSGVLAYDVPEDFEADHMLVNGRGSFADGVRVELD